MARYMSESALRMVTCIVWCPAPLQSIKCTSRGPTPAPSPLRHCWWNTLEHSWLGILWSRRSVSLPPSNVHGATALSRAPEFGNDPAGAAHLGPAVDAGPQSERNEALDGGHQLRILEVVVEHAGRAWVSHEVHIPLLHAAGGEPPVPLRAALQVAEGLSARLPCMLLFKGLRRQWGFSWSHEVESG